MNNILKSWIDFICLFPHPSTFIHVHVHLNLHSQLICLGLTIHMWGIYKLYTYVFSNWCYNQLYFSFLTTLNACMIPNYIPMQATSPPPFFLHPTSFMKPHSQQRSLSYHISGHKNLVFHNQNAPLLNFEDGT
jgi:hypothetical protein